MLTIQSLLKILLLNVLAWMVNLVTLQVQQNSPVRITEPRSGEVLQGLVLIHGTTAVPGFRSTEVAFGYQNDPTASWFVIEKSTEQVKNDLIARWDTSTITDGNYQLRVKVELADGQAVQVLITNLRVRNYSPVETTTPDANPVKLIDPTQTTLPDFQLTGSTPVPLATNPAQLTIGDLYTSAFRGVAFIIAAIVLAGVYWMIRYAIRRY